MKLKFDRGQEYQTDAVDSIIKIFRGQQVKSSIFTVSFGTLEITGQQLTQNGIGNKLDLIDEELIKNIHNVQMDNNLPKSKGEDLKNFTIEMETGTGKTYVYTKTIMELNKIYGFSKFIIVVPSVAIKEGVNKSFQITKEHFEELYPGQHCNFFIYDSSKLEQVRSYATSDSIEVMIINIDAFKKSFDNPEKEDKSNLIHRDTDKLQGQKPIDFIRETNPIVIIDEPQSVDNTPKAKEAISSLNPLFILRYSATHKEKYNLMYKLDPVDAFEQKLVKRIEVLSTTAENDFNNPYIKLISVENKNGYRAKIEIDVKDKRGIAKRIKKDINPSSKGDLYLVSGEREQYKGFVVAGIDCTEGRESIEFENGIQLAVGEQIGTVDDMVIKRRQIRNTIEEHLNKEIYLLPKGIKVITLFFIDKVSNYRRYNEDGTISNGRYAEIFEQEYRDLIGKLKYTKLLENYSEYISEDNILAPDKVHDGYFAQDKKGKLKDSKVNSTKDDENVFNKIMRNKEQLLDLKERLRFIFSHSALKEGWDNPNVFQICTLIDNVDTFTKRQKIGRGLRLCVNQEGERITFDKFDDAEAVNLLTVIANESYEEFANTLQKEIEDETGVKFGYVEKHSFANINHEVVVEENKTIEPIGYEKSEELFNYLVKNNYLNKTGKIQEKLKEDIVSDDFNVPEEFKHIKDEIEVVIKKAIRKLPLYNKKDEVKVKLNKRIYLGEEFKTLWEKIKYKTTYSVDIDTDDLIKQSVKSIKNMQEIKGIKIITEKADIHIERKGVSAEATALKASSVDIKYTLPDIITYLQESTRLTRKTIVDILIKSDRLAEFEKNPQVFMELVAKEIKRVKKNLIVDGIKYEKTGDEVYYTQELFDDKEIIGYMKANAVEVKNQRSIYSHIIYDSYIEKDFAERLDKDPDVKLFVKLPSWFKIDTPIGDYNPDWAILIEKDNEEKLYFVVETKGTTDKEELREKEDGKITCGKKHFEALNIDVEMKVKYEVQSDYKKFKVNI
ncbi:MAG: DEAD/DEAH box helicase family protein [Clostridium sp.]|nr:DEAD/DEAH box helicase family protein [Clostridium sp.]